MLHSIVGYCLPLAVPYRWAKGIQYERSGLLVRVSLDGGEGWGEVAPPPHEVIDLAAWKRQIESTVEGLDPDDPRYLELLDARRPHPRIRCGLATAWLSAQALSAGQSLASHLATPSSPATRVNVNGLVTDGAPESAAETARALTRHGHRTLKIKCTADRAENIDRVEAIRAAVPEAILRVDLNEALRPEQAAGHLNDLARFDIEYAEQPIALHDPASLAALRRASRVPIAADEAATDLGSIRALIAADAVDALILKPQRLGGPDRLLAVARLAKARGIASTVTNSLETAIGLTATLHVAACLAQPIPDCGLGTAHFFGRDVAQPPQIVDGAMDVPTAPGLGLAPDPDFTT